MTQTIQRVKRIPGLPSAVYTPTVAWELVRTFAYGIVEADRASHGTVNVQAVHRLDDALMALRREGIVRKFELGGLEGDEIKVQVIMPDALYTRENRMAVRQRLDSVLSDLNLYTDLSLETDACDDDLAQTR